MLLRRLVLTWLLAGAALTSAVAAPLPRAVLIIDEADPSGGAPTTFSATLRETLDDFTPHVAVYGETLDLRRFSGQSQEATLRSYLQEKYTDVRFGVIAAVGLSALEFVARWRSELWPGVPVVFAAIDESSAAQLKPDPDSPALSAFFTTKEYGLGLGLSICSTIMKTHGGQLTLENNAGGGATVTVTLPAQEAIEVSA